jgi:hypothetical protein
MLDVRGPHLRLYNERVVVRHDLENRSARDYEFHQTNEGETLRSECKIRWLALQFRVGRILKIALAQISGDLGHASAALTEIVRQLDLKSCLEFHRDLDEVEAIEPKVFGETGCGGNRRIGKAQGVPDRRDAAGKGGPYPLRNKGWAAATGATELGMPAETPLCRAWHASEDCAPDRARRAEHGVRAWEVDSRLGRLPPLRGTPTGPCTA